jgi:hypothetical protein
MNSFVPGLGCTNWCEVEMAAERSERSEADGQPPEGGAGPQAKL